MCVEVLPSGFKMDEDFLYQINFPDDDLGYKKESFLEGLKQLAKDEQATLKSKTPSPNRGGIGERDLFESFLQIPEPPPAFDRKALFLKAGIIAKFTDLLNTAMQKANKQNNLQIPKLIHNLADLIDEKGATEGIMFACHYLNNPTLTDLLDEHINSELPKMLRETGLSISYEPTARLNRGSFTSYNA
jgi:hypothetical protein